eukprot:g12258.t1
MVGTGKKKKKKSAAVSEPPTRRSKLTPDERRRVEDMHEILGEVWEPFKTAAGAIRGLEADGSPWLELEFWDSLAEAFLRYFGKAITLQVDTAGLLRAQRASAKSRTADQSFQSRNSGTNTIYSASRNDADSTAGAARIPPSQAKGGGGSGVRDSEASAGRGDAEVGNKDDDGDKAMVSPVVAPEGVSVGGSITTASEAGDHGLFGDAGQEEVGEVGEGGQTLEPSATRLEMLPMGAVGHLSRRDRLGIIRKTVPKERRIVVLQRLFHLAQAPAVEVELLVASVKELKDNSSSAEIRDVNLLQTWQGVREERDAAWEHATEQVRLAAQSAETAGTAAAAAAAVDVEEDAEGENAVTGDDVVVDVDVGVKGGNSDSSASIATGS